MGYLVYVSGNDNKVSLSGSEYTSIEDHQYETYTTDSYTYETTTSTNTTKASYTTVLTSSKSTQITKSSVTNTLSLLLYGRMSTVQSNYTNSSTASKSWMESRTSTQNINGGYYWETVSNSTINSYRTSYTGYSYTETIQLYINSGYNMSYSYWYTYTTTYLAGIYRNYKGALIYTSYRYSNFSKYSLTSNVTSYTYYTGTTNTTTTSKKTTLNSTETFTLTNITSQYGTDRLIVRTGSDQNDIVKYGWTTDSSASEYSPIRAILQNGKTGYIGRHYTTTSYNEIESSVNSYSTNNFNI